MGGSEYGTKLVSRGGIAIEPQLAAAGQPGIGAGGIAAQATVVGVAEASAGRVDVRSRPLAADLFVMVRQCIQARQTGPRREERG